MSNLESYAQRDTHGPLSLDELFEAHLDATSDNEGDDVDTARELNLPENDPEDAADLDPDDAEGANLEEDEVDGHMPFAPSPDDADADEDSGEATERESDDDEAGASDTEVTFADLHLPADLLQAVTDMGFQTPTAIQREAIPILLAGRDVVGVAQTGTGKTAAFGLPLLDAVDAPTREVQALVLAPTRELALQSAEAITEMASRSRGLNVVAVYGGAPYGPQIGALKAGAQVVVGTPGRVIDLLDKGALRLEQVRFFVLDEADEMLRMGFAEDVETIASSLPAERRTALFSATMPPAIQAVARQHLRDPQRIEVSPQSSTVDTVHQTYAVVPFRHKIGAVSRVLAVTSAQAAIVFVRTKSTAEDVAIELAGRGIQAAAISGDVPQRERERLVERLRTGTLDVLVATDVAARGLDVDRIGLVVNFDVPREAEAYVHRIGRTGRAGRHGEAITFLTPKEKGKLRQIERLTGTRLEEMTLPSPADVSRHRAAALLDKAAARYERGRLEMYTDMLRTKATDLDVEVADLAATLMALAVGDAGPKTWQERRDEPQQRVRREETVDDEGTFVRATFEGGREREGKKRRDRDGAPRSVTASGRSSREGSGTVYRVEVGHRDRVLPGAIVGALANEGGISGSDIGKIDILQSFSLVEIYAPLSAEQLKVMGQATFGGRELRIRPDEGPGHGWSGDNPPSEASARRTERPHDSHDKHRGHWDREERAERAPRTRHDENSSRADAGRCHAERSDRRGDWKHKDDRRGGERGGRSERGSRWSDRGDGGRSGARRDSGGRPWREDRTGASDRRSFSDRGGRGDGNHGAGRDRWDDRREDRGQGRGGYNERRWDGGRRGGGSPRSSGQDRRHNRYGGHDDHRGSRGKRW